MRNARHVVWALIALLLPACGGSSGTSSTPVATPTPAPTTRNIFSRNFSVGGNPSSDSVIFGFQDVSVPAAGQIEVIFDYTFATSDIDIVVTPTTCSDFTAAYNSQCTVHGSDKGPATATKRARTTFNLTAAGNIRIWIYNFTPAAESGVLNVLLTS
jgi:hypothetical protein